MKNSVTKHSPIVKISTESALRRKINDYIMFEKDVTMRQRAQSYLTESGTQDLGVLEDMFCKSLSFGTAGFRGIMEPGFNRINSVTIMQISQALALYLLKTYGESQCQKNGVIIGFDARHNSLYFAHVAAAVFLSKNFKVYLNSEPTQTPFIPFGVLQYKCVAGCQITASHNPKMYNGYKIYNRDGAQVAPPMETEIQEILSNYIEPWDKAMELINFERKTLISGLHAQDPYVEIFKLYMEKMSSDMLANKNLNYTHTCPAVYTALHGVGSKAVVELLRRFNFDLKQLYLVPEQCTPDPEFPTVKFPNPEEDGALDMAIKLASMENVNIILANDPDADRFACVEKQSDGTWRSFTGDEIGIIFAAENLERLRRLSVPKESIVFICSVVSSRMLKTFAEAEGCHYEETMTGFKWMMQRAIELQKKGYTLGLAYEEALGFALHPGVPDKDGISSTAFAMQMLARFRASQMSLAGFLEELNKKYGYFVTKNSYFTVKNMAHVKHIFDEFRNHGNYKPSIGDFTLHRIRDITTGYDNGCTGNVCCFPKTPDNENMTLFFENGAIITFRTSGTEPKLKYYAEMRGKCYEEAEATLNLVLKETINSCIQPTHYGLIHASEVYA